MLAFVLLLESAERALDVGVQVEEVKVLNARRRHELLMTTQSNVQLVPGKLAHNPRRDSDEFIHGKSMVLASVAVVVTSGERHKGKSGMVLFAGKTV